MSFLDALRISIRNLRESRVFFAANVVAISVGVFLVVIMLSLATGIRRYVESLLQREVGATMIEVTANRRSGAAPLTSDRIQQLGQDPRIVAVTPVVQGVFGDLRERGGTEALISLWSTTGATDPEITRYAYAAGGPRAMSEERVIVPEAVASDMGIFPASAAIGRIVTLRITRGGAAERDAWEIPLTVAGVARQTRFSRCYVALPLMERIVSWQNGSARGSVATPFVFDTALLYTGRVNDVTGVRKDVEARGYHTASILDTVRRYGEITRLIAIVLGSLGGIALFTGSVSIFNTAWAAVMRRVKEFAIYKTYGGTRRWIVIVVMIEAIMTSAIAAILGFAGAAAGRLLMKRFLMSDVGFDLLPVEPFLLVIAFAVSAIACVGASVWPALQAARLSPAEALRSS